MLVSGVSGKYVGVNAISGKWVGGKCGRWCEEGSRGWVAVARVLVV